MDLAAIAKVAMDLGVIPAAALFLLVSMHRQNKRLTDLVERREADNMEMIKVLVEVVAQKRDAKGGSHGA